MKSVAERIKEARLEKGLSQAALAMACNVSDSAIQMYESGQRVPRDSIKKALSAVLGKPVQDLFF